MDEFECEEIYSFFFSDLRHYLYDTQICAEEGNSVLHLNKSLNYLKVFEDRIKEFNLVGERKKTFLYNIKQYEDNTDFDYASFVLSTFETIEKENNNGKN